MIFVVSCSVLKGESFDQLTVTKVTAEDVKRLVSQPDAKAVLVNMWATWCVPCVKELPDLVKLAHEYEGRGLRVLLVSNDDEKQLADVTNFLVAHGVDFPCYIKVEKDNEFINAIDSRWSGALPTTFLYDGNGNLKELWEGSKPYAQLEEKIKPLLGNR